MTQLKKYFFLLIAVLIGGEQAYAQFRDDFNPHNLLKDSTGMEGWTYFTGDGTATMEFEEGDGAATIKVDATSDRQNIWWALIKRQVSSSLNLKRLSKPEFELQVEARVRVSHAPRRVNLSVNSQRTTDYHTNLMEFYIDDTLNWHTLSFTTRNFEAQPGDTIYAQLALMDWGLEKYEVDIDYFKVEVVNRKTAKPDRGILTPYHPPVPSLESFRYHLPVTQDATIDLQYPDMNFNNWSVQDGGESKTLLNVNGSQFTILRWNLDSLAGKEINGPGLLELSTYDLQKNPDYKKDFGMIRVVEILSGEPEWNEKDVNLENLLQGKSLKEVFNPQMIIDVEVEPGRNGKNLITIPEHVLRRMQEGKTLGIVIKPLGAVNASFYSRENNKDHLTPKLHLDLRSTDPE